MSQGRKRLRGTRKRGRVRGRVSFSDLMLNIHNVLESFGHILAITKDEDYLQSPDKQAKVRDLEKQIDPVRCLLSSGVDQMVYKLYDLTPEEIAIVVGRSNNGNKTRQAADKQQKAIEVLLGKTLLRVFDFEEDREG